MISVHEAQQKILETIPLRSPTDVPLKEAVSRCITEEIRSPIDTPSFDNSAMDGYAIRSSDLAKDGNDAPVFLRVTEIIAAGDFPTRELKSGEAARIFTGAMIPKGADTVIMQEDVEKQDGGIVISQSVKHGSNIRRRGEELKKGDVVFRAEDSLTPAGIGLLASLGLRQVSVYSPPRIGIIVTGSEIINDPLEYETGKIFDSNSFALSAALQELSIVPSFVKRCPDDKGALQEAIATGFDESDFLIITGGVSVGDYDFVREISKKHGVEEVFWKVKQKPGKPIYFGRKNDTQFLFGLPGNPASSLVCYYEYVRTAILKAMGNRSPRLPQIQAPLKNASSKKGNRRHFLRARFDGINVEVLEQQGSHTMQSFAQANCLVIFPEEKNQMEAGELVEVHLL